MRGRHTGYDLLRRGLVPWRTLCTMIADVMGWAWMAVPTPFADSGIANVNRLSRSDGCRAGIRTIDALGRTGWGGSRAHHIEEGCASTHAHAAAAAHWRSTGAGQLRKSSMKAFPALGCQVASAAQSASAPSLRPLTEWASSRVQLDDTYGYLALLPTQDGARARAHCAILKRVSRSASIPVPGYLATNAAVHLCTVHRERCVWHF
ncbi:hypothetical protein HYPSUDRAFT_1017804 [Hypholoma sublateritium FD-334 SS-4]|uniref:Uncharacterized protein n=1 Tax=Hypholoma sublateritium (strain FD-334 SS-4) TaxID=945553 RepID=A0A0D2PAU2_HYPSF|nr:hypothetical protein HYPSUDRAFT_1017804 [Hypholoma sublateritium FD-334 SS-4]